MMRTANPALNDNVFRESRMLATSSMRRMTVSGVVNRTLLLILIVIATATFSWSTSTGGHAGFQTSMPFLPSAWVWIGLFGGLILALITIFKKTWAPITAPLYAAFEGLFLGAVSAGFEARYPGIVFQAVLGTMGTLLTLLAAYRSGLVRATANFKLGVVAATGGIALIYILSMILGFFGVQVSAIHESGPIGIGFSLVVVAIAALNLVLDFDFIENGERSGAPKFMEWYAAFGLLVTLVWLYMEILRLIAKLRRR